MSRHLHRLAAALAVVLGVTLAVPGWAAAHTGLSASDPAADSRVEGPLDRVVLIFTGTPTAFDDSIAVADASGATFSPVSVVQTDLEVVATFDPPLAAGSYAMAWQVRSDDTHYVDGSFSFVVTAPAAAPTTVESTTAPATTVPATTIPAEAGAAEAAAPTTASPTSVAVSADETEMADGMEMADGSTMSADDHTTMVSPPSLGGDAVDTAEGDGVTRIGRLLYLPAGVVALGMVAFAASAFVGRRDELETLVRTARWLGVFVALGAVIEVAGLVALVDGFGELIGLGAGRASLARAVAGVMVVVGFASVGATAPAGVRSPVRSLSSAVAEAEVGPADTTDRWRPTPLDAVGLGGLVVFALSFAFDGHTLSRGPRLLHSVSSVVHVVGAGVWAGGLVALAVVLTARRRDGAPTRAVEPIVRFSVVAMAALTATGVAGVAMALFIDSDVFGYPSTEWGRYMIAKLVAVAAAAGIGAWNHFVLLPRLRARPDDTSVVDVARTTVTVEAAVVVTVAFITALLVAASTL